MAFAGVSFQISYELKDYNNKAMSLTSMNVTNEYHYLPSR